MGNQGDRYPTQNQGDRYPNQNQGGRYPEENPGVRFPEDNQGSRYPGENQGGRNPGQGQQYPSRGDQSDGGQEDRYRPYQPENNPASMGQQDYYVEPGNNVQLVADVIGNMSPGISTIWKRGNGQPINQRHYQQNNILYINNAERVDEGIYVCQGVDNRGSILFEYNANLRIAASPRVRLDPPSQIVRPGDSPQIECQIIQGDQPINIQWSREGSSQLPRSVAQNGAILQFQRITVSDQGRYVCKASNEAGQSEAVAEVIVNDAGDDGAIIETQQLSSSQGATVDLPCRLAASDDMKWQREGGSLPQRATQVRTALRIERVTVEDSGKYICTSQGRMQYVNLMVERLTANPSKPEITIKQSEPTAYVGSSIDVTCEVTGLPSRGHVVKWSKVAHSELGENVKNRGKMMRIEELTKDNEGLYRCTVETRAGTFYEDFNLSVQDNPEPADQPVHQKSVNYHSRAELECRTTLQPPIQAVWSRHHGTLPREAVTQKSTLIIPSVREEDAGAYTCTATTEMGAVAEVSTILVVTGVVPC